jgi:hypothetical protein
MANLTPILANEKTAAALLDMPVTEFRALVDGGHLPKGREIAPGVIRWEAEALRQIARGDAIDGGIQW